MKKTGVGLASFGVSGEIFHAPLIRVHPGFEIVSVFERNKNISASSCPEASIVRNYQDLLEDKRVELVIVNTPDNLHYEMTKLALLAGKHVVVEKPFVQKSENGEELIKLAKEKGHLLSVFQNRRWDGDFLSIRKILENGLLGRLVEYEAHFDRFRGDVDIDSWKEDADSGAGILYNLGSHLIDQVLVLFGKPESVNAELHILRDNGMKDDAFTILLGYPELKLTLRGSYLVKEAGPRFSLHGTKGSFLKYGLDPQEDALKRGELPMGEDWGKEPETDWGLLNTEVGEKPFKGKYETLPGQFGEYYNNLYQAIHEGAELAVSAEEANMVIRVIEAARKSNETGQRIYL